jgi:hypothetical protein
MKKILLYIGSFALGCLNGYLLNKHEEPKIEAPFDDRLIELLSEYEE